ncbi:MAG: MogA/MoaB family molybdenum cofactor biosynthesis protein [Bacteroidales bacterium]|nr:MogA/MoaB family molybdenum cofactor biosynthesis protein [Bacteroidales bacterium]
MKLPERFEILVVTLSDRASDGRYEDRSGPAVCEKISEYFTSIDWRFKISSVIIPDDAGTLRNMLLKAGNEFNLIFTTGGTGIGPRDITVETLAPLMKKAIPGIMEFIRVKYGSVKPNALLSGGVAGIIGNSLVYTLPGSVRAVEEYMSEITKTLKHTILMQYGIDDHPAH